MLKVAVSFVFVLVFANTLAQTQSGLDSVFYKYLKGQEYTGAIYRIIENKKNSGRRKESKLYRMIDGSPECYIVLDQKNSGRAIKLIRRYLNGRGDKYYLFYNSINQRRLQTWYPLNRAVDLNDSSRRRMPLHFEPFGKIGKFQVSSTFSKVMLHTIEIEAEFLQQVRFIDLILPKLKTSGKYFQVILIEPI